MSRRLWRVGGSALAVVTLASFAWEAVDQLASRPETRTDRVAADGVDRIVVEVDDGDVVVTATPGATQVVARAELRTGIVDPDYAVVRSGRTLRVTARCSAVSDNCLERLRLSTPSDVEVQVTSDNGRLEVRGVDGDVEATTANGDVEIDGVTGRLTMRSDNGELTGRRLGARIVEASSDNGSVRLAFEAAPTRVIADSDNGDIEVGLPRSVDVEGTDFAVTATSDNGTVATPIRTNPASSRSIQASSDNGDVTVAYRP